MKLQKIGMIVLFLTLTLNLAAASPAELDIFPQHSSTRVDSFTTYEVTVKNTGPVEDVYDLTTSHPSEMTVAPNQVPETGTLKPGESEEVQVWFNPDLDREEGTYTFTVTATSEATGERYNIQGQVEVIREHDVGVEVEGPGPVCRGEQAKYNVFVTNSGTQKETFRVSSEAGYLSQKKVTVDAGSTKMVTLQRSSDLAVEDRAFNINVESTTSYADDATSASFVVEKCYESETTVNPQNKRTAALTEAEFEVTVQNKGTRSDEFVLSTNYGELEDTNLTVASGDSKTTTLEYTPKKLKDRTIRVTAEGKSTSTGTANLDVYNGQNVSVSFYTKSASVCEKEEFERKVVVENTGVAEDTYKLSTSRGKLSNKKVTLEPGEMRELEVDLNSTPLATGKSYKVKVTAQSQTFSKPRVTGTSTFKVENCWDLEMDVVPHLQSAGENRSILYEIHLNNTGTKNNDYRVWADGPEWISVEPKFVSVAAGEMDKSYIWTDLDPNPHDGQLGSLPYNQTDSPVKITAQAEGEQVKKQKTVTLEFDEEVKKAIKSDKGGGITGFFSRAASDLVDAVTGAGDLTKIVVSILVGLVISAVILAREW